MDHEVELDDVLSERTVYVRRIKVADLPEELREQAPDQELFYAIYSEEGENLALARDRQLAFAVARTNDLNPVSVH